MRRTFTEARKFLQENRLKKSNFSQNEALLQKFLRKNLAEQS